MLKYTTAGESHGRGVIVILEGLPAGIPLQLELINAALAARQKGPGRGGRMKIESDQADVLSGVRGNYTLGSPIAIAIWNRDYQNWTDKMSAFGDNCDEKVTVPRPGHADLAGIIKYGHRDIRNVIERASARETAGRVAAGEICRQFLKRLGITIQNRIVEAGGTDCSEFDEPSLNPEYMKTLKNAREEGDTLGAKIEVTVTGVPIGLGSYAGSNTRLDSALTEAAMTVPSVKAVSIGEGFSCSSARGSSFHDPFILEGEPGNIKRTSNNAGGIEGGISNGMPVKITACFKPIPTLISGLESVDISDMKSVTARYERSDICVAEAAGLVLLSEIAVVIARELLRKFGGDSMDEVADRVGRWRNDCLKRLQNRRKKHIWLVGFMGSGKSETGRRLAEIMNMNFVDTDEQVSSEYGMSPGEIIRHFGEECFRGLESSVVNRLSALTESTVIATGGGAFIQKHLREIMLQEGITVWLKCSEDVIEKRCADDSDRPLFNGDWRGLLSRREKFYKKAHFTMAADEDSGNEIAGQIKKNIIESFR